MELMNPHVSIDRDAVSAFCQRHHITRLALFGSVLRDDFGPDGDVDVLVESRPAMSGFNFVSIGARVLRTVAWPPRRYGDAKVSHPRIRDQILSSAEPLYVAA